MIEIDGSAGEGGGQILRTPAALAVHIGEGIHVVNVRAKRPRPGLKAQHVTVLEALAEISGGSLTGVDLGSREITFEPGSIRGGSYEFDIGTAGSIPLLFLTLVLALAETRERIEVVATGGTDAKWAPPWDHFLHVFLPLARMAGADADAILHRRGYVPAGGGKATLVIRPGKLRPLVLESRSSPTPPRIEGIINIAGLDERIAKRMRSSAANPLISRGYQVAIRIERAEATSPGVGIVLWTSDEGPPIGSSALGEKGIPAERLGESAAREILTDIEACVAVDPHGADQILPFMALAPVGSSFTVRELTSHTTTEMALIEQMLGRRISVSYLEGSHLVEL